MIEDAPGRRAIERPDDELDGIDQAPLQAVPAQDFSLAVGDGEVEVDGRHPVIVAEGYIAMPRNNFVGGVEIELAVGPYFLVEKGKTCPAERSHYLHYSSRYLLLGGELV